MNFFSMFQTSVEEFRSALIFDNIYLSTCIGMGDESVQPWSSQISVTEIRLGGTAKPYRH